MCGFIYFYFLYIFRLFIYSLFYSYVQRYKYTTQITTWEKTIHVLAHMYIFPYKASFILAQNK